MALLFSFKEYLDIATQFIDPYLARLLSVMKEWTTHWKQSAATWVYLIIPLCFPADDRKKNWEKRVFSPDANVCIGMAENEML